MQLIRRAHQFEYRDHRGVDRVGVVDVWTSAQGDEAVLVLRDLVQAETIEHARRALHTLTHTWLPYLLRPDASLAVLVLRPREDEDAKARGFVLPLSA
ncbi:hypothetical protein DAETH_18600 [Deinococcus aetherius]|uniref:Uncharacterized protein n=1 Tax=Deinococcus aetherius TaxID=200252 RepID=A0ABN6RJK2_9DEIO|nr:hypothetical protein [Deinococcus aetherius]BDP41891.1 hypothetical protein DAETH_18600 [Deinococcus aetherius]